MPFNIIIKRHHDGRYIATIPDLHPSFASAGLTLQYTLRKVQADALSMIAGMMRTNSPLPDEIKQWFCTTSDTGVTAVGGCLHNQIPDEKLMFKVDDILPPPPPLKTKPSLPKSGTLEHKQMLSELVAQHAAMIKAMEE